MQIDSAKAPGGGAAALLAAVGGLPQVELERESASVTCVRFHGRRIARVDSVRERVETRETTLQLTSPSRVRSALALIRRCVDEAAYHWQLSSASP